MRNKNHGMTLVELSIAVILLSLLVLSYHGIDYFTRGHTIDANRRVKMQNELAFVLEHMSKNVQLGIGYGLGGTGGSQPPLVTLADGFRVRVDINTPQTPSDLTDDTSVDYTLTGNSLSCSLGSEVLATHIVSGVGLSSGGVPADPDKGFYVDLSEDGTVIEVGLVARWYPTQARSSENPEVIMKNKMYTRCASTK
jgi:prepilin-type N-terminal cleavage/methylation domain-containing protein